MIGKLETSFKSAVRNATVKIARAIIIGRSLCLLPRHNQEILLGSQFDLAFGKASNCERDPVGILARPFDVVGRVVCAAGISAR